LIFGVIFRGFAAVRLGFCPRPCPILKWRIFRYELTHERLLAHVIQPDKCGRSVLFRQRPGGATNSSAGRGQRKGGWPGSGQVGFASSAADCAIRLDKRFRQKAVVQGNGRVNRQSAPRLADFSPGLTGARVQCLATAGGMPPLRPPLTMTCP
jgi:hypothetical protein